MVTKGFMCEKWAGDWTKTATYWPPVLLAIAALISILRDCSTGGPEGPDLCWVLFSLLRTATSDSKLWSLTNWLPVAPGYIIVWHPPASVCVASAPNSTRQQSRLSPDIFNRMHLLITQVHLTARPGRRSICYNYIYIYIYIYISVISSGRSETMSVDYSCVEYIRDFI